jgi:hypothetical protein
MSKLPSVVWAVFCVLFYACANGHGDSLRSRARSDGSNNSGCPDQCGEPGKGNQPAAVTDAQGRYLLTALDAGTYRVSAEKSGFKTAVLNQVVVTVGGSSVELRRPDGTKYVDSGARSR